MHEPTEHKKNIQAMREAEAKGKIQEELEKQCPTEKASEQTG